MKWRLAFLIALFALLLIYVGARCWRDSHWAHWIIFPAAVEAATRPIANVETEFRREFSLSDKTQSAHLSVRAAKYADVKINGRPLNLGNAPIDVVDLVRPGKNLIEATVTNDSGPPALQLFLETPQLKLRADEKWEASISGSVWRNAIDARAPRFANAGNAIFGSERTFDVLKRIWPTWLGFVTIALVGVVTLRRRVNATALLLTMSILWSVLFINNARLMPYRSGFDSRDHFDYIKYISEHCALPMPDEGNEMFQPPLYYVISAVVFSISRSAVALRALTMGFGVAHFVFVFLCLRLLFRDRADLPLIGTTIAAFLPMLLYLSHYVTNETLAAMLTTATVYLMLRFFRQDTISLGQCALLGACMGAAIMAKATSVVLLPALLFSLSILRRNRIRNVAMVAVFSLAIGGWHYVRIGWQSDRPFLGVAGNFAWWGDPGYRILSDYFRFGRSLVAPFFSGFNGFADGIFSTLWGDGLCGGASNLDFRPPWNYSLMAGGYWLAVVPSLLIVVGIVIAIAQLVRKPTPETVLLLGLFAMVVFALIEMSLKVPAIAQVKAFFAMCALVPLSYFGALGWDAITRGHRVLRFAMATLLLVWAMNSFASVWVRSSAAQHLYAALRLEEQGKIDMPVAEARRAITAEPSNVKAHRIFSSLLGEAGLTNEAMSEAETAVRLNGSDSNAHFQLGSLLAKQNEKDRALSEAQRAIELGPENAAAYNLVLLCLFDLGRYDEVHAVAREALAVSPFNPTFRKAVKNETRD